MKLQAIIMGSPSCKAMTGAAMAILLCATMASATSSSWHSEDKCKHIKCPKSWKPCETYKCNPQTGNCEKSHVSNDTPCHDKDKCTYDTKCYKGACVGKAKQCTPSPNTCEKTYCDPWSGKCKTTHEPNGKACDDKNACTTDDKCYKGKCVGKPKHCEPSKNTCEKTYCDASSGQCKTSHKPNGSHCDDGNKCTKYDRCNLGKCEGKHKCAETQYPCKKISCHPLTGKCVYELKPDGEACDDNSACTTDDKCYQGKCVGKPKHCEPSKNTCEKTYCDTSSGQCKTTHKPNGDYCNDGNKCTYNDRCYKGTCIGEPKKCPRDTQCKTYSSCDPTYGCCKAQYKADGTPCNDYNKCTTHDQCYKGGCKGKLKWNKWNKCKWQHHG